MLCNDNSFSLIQIFLLLTFLISLSHFPLRYSLTFGVTEEKRLLDELHFVSSFYFETMPQGKLRSGVYRSFIMCDDPRGVVECGEIRKHKKGTTRFENSLKGKEKPETVRRNTEEISFTEPSSMQLLKVSRGIQKLNTAIESWSKGLSYEARPEEIAKDLLRGALDLEESLAMLTSLQEASSDHMKQKPRITSQRRDLRFQRSMSDRFGDWNPGKSMEKRMISEDVASKDCYEELRNVIRESFIRQNLLTETKDSKTKTWGCRSDVGSSSGAASTSSSQSSTNYLNDSGSTKSSVSSDNLPKAPSLIARLMGLDASPQENPGIQKLKAVQAKRNESPIRCNLRESALRSSPKVFIRPKIEEKTGRTRPVLLKKPRMQGEIHPRMINQRKDEVTEASKRKEMVKKVEEKQGKVIKKLLSPGVTRDRKPIEPNKKLVKKEDVASKDRYKPHERVLKPPNSSDISRNKALNGQRSRLSSSSTTCEQKSSSRLKKTGEVPTPNHKSRNLTSGSSKDTSGSVNQLSSELQIQGHRNNGEVSSPAATMQPCREVKNPDTDADTQISLESFLSTSPDFLSYAGDLLDFNTNTKRSRETVFQNRDNIKISDQRLALDFAKEVAGRRRSVLLAETTCSKRNCVQIDELLMEVCDGFEDLRSYRDMFLGQNNFVNESIEMMLEKDLKDKKTEMESGVWDLGWRSEFQRDETHQTVNDLEKLILSNLIQEIIS